MYIYLIYRYTKNLSIIIYYHNATLQNGVHLSHCGFGNRCINIVKVIYFLYFSQYLSRTTSLAESSLNTSLTRVTVISRAIVSTSVSFCRLELGLKTQIKSASFTTW